MKDKQIKEYLREIIVNNIFKDIENCINAKANYPVALALLSHTEFLGGLITGNLGVQGKSESNFNSALEFFEWNGDKNYYKKFKLEIQENDGSISKGNGIYKLIRCGLVHEYFIKGQSFVHNNQIQITDNGCIDSDKGVQVIEHSGQKLLRFHNNAYFRDFKLAWKKYMEEITINNDPKLISNFSNSISRIHNRKFLFE